MGRRGPKKQEGKRERNGQLSRKPQEAIARVLEKVDRDIREALSVALEARVRVHAIKPELSRDQMAGSYLGRLCMSGQISRLQYEAGMLWAEDATNYAVAMASQPGPRAINLGAVGGLALTEEDIERSQRAYDRHEKAMKAVQAAQLELRNTGNLFAALETLVMRDIGLEHMVPDYRVAANALARHYKLSGQRRAA